MTESGHHGVGLLGAGMDVKIIFDEAFSGEVDGAVWIIDTPSNRRWYAAGHGACPGSAIFQTDRYPIRDDAVIRMIWNAQEHNPDWTALTVIGAALTHRISDKVGGDGRLTEETAGFTLSRP